MDPPQSCWKWAEATATAVECQPVRREYTWFVFGPM